MESLSEQPSLFPTPESSEESVKVTINLNALRAFAEQALKETIQFVAFGLATAELAEPDDIHLPGALIAIGHPDFSMSKVRSGYGDWLVGLCLRRYVEVYHNFLDEVGKIALLAEFQRQPFYYNSDEVGEQFNAMGLPRKLDRIDKALALEVSPELRRNIESINYARNCFEHRRGIVQERDFHGMGALVVSWVGVDAVRISASDTETPVYELPVILAPREGLRMSWKARSKSFQLGEQIRLSTVDVSEIGLTFLRHSNDLSIAIGETFNKQRN